jgi:hypothetical protein
MEEKRLAETEVHRAVDILRELNEKMGRIMAAKGNSDRGGYFVLSDDIVPPARYFRTVSRTGAATEEFEGYRLYAEEKAARLLVNHRDHATSWQSRDEANHKYGGAIRVKFSGIGLILSFSGYAESCDEALMLALAMKMGWLDHHAAIDLATNCEVVANFLKLFEV